MPASDDDRVAPTHHSDIQPLIEEIRILRSEVTSLKKSLSHLPFLSAMEASFNAAAYFNKNLQNKPTFNNKLELIKSSIELLDGDVIMPLEFGVFNGSTINFISKLVGADTFVYGFDSFIGLPEDWYGGFKKGSFCVDKLPPVEENVRLIKGWFDDTLPLFISENLIGKKTNFIHIDCDLYSSTKTIFNYLHKYLTKDAIIVFDEYFNYPGWQQHEERAFKEFIRDTGRSFDYIGCVPSHQQVAVRLK